MPASVRPSGPAATMPCDAASSWSQMLPSAVRVHGHANEPLFLARDNYDGVVPMDIFSSLASRSRACGRTSQVCSPANAATTTAAAAATATAPVGSFQGCPGASQAPPLVVSAVVVKDDEEPLCSSSHHVGSAAPKRVAVNASAPATSPAALHCSGRLLPHKWAIYCTTDSHNAAHGSSLGAEVLTDDVYDEVEKEWVTSTVADDPALDAAPLRGAGFVCTSAAEAAPAPEASPSAACGSQRRPSLLPAGT